MRFSALSGESRLNSIRRCNDWYLEEVENTCGHYRINTYLCDDRSTREGILSRVSFGQMVLGGIKVVLYAA
jgi:hypothetical protein